MTLHLSKIHALIRCLVVIRPGCTRKLFCILDTLNNNSREAYILPLLFLILKICFYYHRNKTQLLIKFVCMYILVPAEATKSMGE